MTLYIGSRNVKLSEFAQYVNLGRAWIEELNKWFIVKYLPVEDSVEVICPKCCFSIKARNVKESLEKLYVEAMKHVKQHVFPPSKATENVASIAPSARSSGTEKSVGKRGNRMKLISVHLPEHLVNELEDLVRKGYFPSRSEAIRVAVHNLIMRYKDTEIGKTLLPGR